MVGCTGLLNNMLQEGKQLICTKRRKHDFDSHQHGRGWSNCFKKLVNQSLRKQETRVTLVIGATRYVLSHVANFYNVEIMQNISVQLPAGRKVRSNERRFVSFTPRLGRTVNCRVYYWPSLHRNFKLCWQLDDFGITTAINKDWRGTADRETNIAVIIFVKRKKNYVFMVAKLILPSITSWRR